MKKSIVLAALTAMLTLAVASPAFAKAPAATSGDDYGLHHAAMAEEMTGFTGDMNPGVHHKGFSGWTGM